MRLYVVWKTTWVLGCDIAQQLGISVQKECQIKQKKAWKSLIRTISCLLLMEFNSIPFTFCPPSNEKMPLLIAHFSMNTLETRHAHVNMVHIHIPGFCQNNLYYTFQCWQMCCNHIWAHSWGSMTECDHHHHNESRSPHWSGSPENWCDS